MCLLDGEPIARSLAQKLAEQRGMVIRERVTKDLDYLVVADPDTMSGKAKQARKYGVRILAELPFWQKLGVAVDADTDDAAG